MRAPKDLPPYIGPQVVKRVDRLEADDGDGIVDVWTKPNPDGDYVELEPGTAVEANAFDWQPGRWWRVVAPDGSVWCESSSEEENREAVRPGDRLYCQRRVELLEWIEVNPEEAS